MTNAGGVPPYGPVSRLVSNFRLAMMCSASRRVACSSSLPNDALSVTETVPFAKK
jgi:hypothetical protein